jgi:hypothetical protein
MGVKIEIDSDLLKDMCDRRVGEFYPARSVDDDFWADFYQWADDNGWPFENLDPMYLVDNIAVNWSFAKLSDLDGLSDILPDYEFEELKDILQKKDINKLYDWIDKQGYDIIGDFLGCKFKSLIYLTS